MLLQCLEPETCISMLMVRSKGRRAVAPVLCCTHTCRQSFSSQCFWAGSGVEMLISGLWLRMSGHLPLANLACDLLCVGGDLSVFEGFSPKRQQLTKSLVRWGPVVRGLPRGSKPREGQDQSIASPHQTLEAHFCGLWKLLLEFSIPASS